MGKDNLSGKKKYTNGKISRFFLPGTQPIGWWLGCTETYRKKQATATVKSWQKANYRLKQSETRSTDAFKERLKEQNKEAWQRNREQRCKNIAAGIERYYSDGQKRSEAYKKRSAMQKQKWSEPDYRAKQTQKLKEGKKDIYTKHPEYLSKITEGNKKAWKDDHEGILKKQSATKRRRGRDLFSKKENKYYEYLLTIYTADDIVRQYRDARYPFNCDFYIKSEDRFIEIQGTWTHGKHPFNPNSIEDAAILAEWQEKAKQSKYYETAIYIWTVLDVKKRHTAEENKIQIDFIY